MTQKRITFLIWKSKKHSKSSKLKSKYMSKWSFKLIKELFEVLYQLLLFDFLKLNFVWNVHRHIMFWERKFYVTRKDRPSIPCYVNENNAKFKLYTASQERIYPLITYALWKRGHFESIICIKNPSSSKNWNYVC